MFSKDSSPRYNASGESHSEGMPGSVERFLGYQDFPLDDFQTQAAQSIERGSGVLVCAPTGAGKTIVGEYAAFNAIENGASCFYTTPIKALSNQKYHDFVDFYGEDSVGLLTGDVSINPEAPIVVMTTEILRNMLYAQSDRLDNLSHVVMDEVHYLADKSRGYVWEETILNLDTSVTLVALSATVSNSEEFGNWLKTIRKECDVIITDKRPVPLNQYMMVGEKIIPLFGKDNRTNPSLKKAIGVQEENGKTRPIKRADAIRALAENAMLPAIYFIFSRVGCDEAVRQTVSSGLNFTSESEAQEIIEYVDAEVADISPEDLRILGFSSWRKALSRGIAAHHAGMLPAFRHIVEKLFVNGYLKVVFATETLALGINMPARSVVIEKMTKFNGETHADLTPAQYTQLTGRAGRRGIDTLGNAIVLWNESVDPDYVSKLASTRSYPLNSTFKPGYNMSVNLLSTKGFDQSHELLQRSFAQFQTDGSVVHYAQDIEHAQKEKQESEQGLRADLTHLTGTGRAGKPVIPEDVDEAYDELLSFAALRQDLNSAEREARVTAHEERGKEISSYLASLNRGDVIALPTGKNPDLAVVVAPARFPKDPAPVIITDHGWNGRIRAADMGNLPITVGHMRLPGHPKRQSKKITQATSSALRRARFDKPKRIKQISSSGHSQKVRGLQQALHDHPVYDWPEREALAHWAQKVLKAQRTIDYLEFHAHGGKGLGKQFDSILNLLSELDYVDSPDGQANSNSTVTAEGDHLADIHHELDLLIAQSLRRGIWDDLDPAELAAVVSTVSFENRREKSGKTKYPTENVDKAISATQRVYGELASDENRYGIDQSRELDTSFALALHQWTTGAPLEYCLQAADYSGAELTIGDFVRSCRQAIEVLEQIKRSGYSDDIRKNARQAVQAINTGVVQLSA